MAMSLFCRNNDRLAETKTACHQLVVTGRMGQDLGNANWSKN
jgi:hypothetical protein